MLKQIKNKVENLYFNMDNLSLRNIQRELYDIIDDIQDYRFSEGKKIDYELSKLLLILGVDIYEKKYEELKRYILKIKNIIEFIEIL